MDNSAAKNLYDLLVTRDLEPEILDSAGKPISDPSEAELLSFDWKTENQNYGSVVILLGEENQMEVFYGDNLGRSMEGDDKRQWYKFLEQLKDFAARNLMTFELNNINRLKYTMQGMAAIKEGLFEGYYGKKNISYSDQPKETKLMIKHTRNLGEDEARYRAIDSLFVETAEGERFKLPFRNLMCGKVMARHVSEGGNPYDAFGQHISHMVAEMATLNRFIRAARRKNFSGDAGAMVETAIKHYSDLKAKAKHMISRRGYLEARDQFDPAAINEAENMVEHIRSMFIEQTLDQRIEEALPILAKLQPQHMKEVKEFENWTQQMTEGTWAMPKSPEEIQRLQELMSKELIVGPDATNATEQLYDIIGDDQLFDYLEDIANLDPDANAWDDVRVMDRISELVPELQVQVEGAPRGRPKGTGHPFNAIDNRDDGLPRIGKVEKTATGLKHYARPERGGTLPEPETLATLDKNFVNKMDNILGVKWKQRGQKGVQVDEAAGQYEPVKIGNTLPKEGPIHDIPGRLNKAMIPGFRDTSTSEEYSDSFYYRDPMSGGVFVVYSHGRIPRVRGTDGMDERRVSEIAQSLAWGQMEEDLDPEGIMRTVPSNMSSESQERDGFNRLIELARV